MADVEEEDGVGKKLGVVRIIGREKGSEGRCGRDNRERLCIDLRFFEFQYFFKVSCLNG